MTFNYVAFRDGVVDRLLTRYGASNFAYTFVKKGTYDPVTRSQTDNSVTATVTGVVLGPMHNFIDQSVVKIADAKFLLDPRGLDETPRQGDRIVIDSVTYYVADLKQVRPNGVTTVLWILALNAGSE